MVIVNNAERHALFQVTNNDGTRWLFVIIADQGWAITCNGEQVAIGRSDRISVNRGVKKYMEVTKAVMPQLQIAVA